MDKEKATVRIAEMRAWLANNEEVAGGLAPLVEAQLTYLGTLSEEEDIKNIWGAITGMLRTLGDKSPIKRGKGSSLSPEQQGVVSGVRVFTMRLPTLASLTSFSRFSFNPRRRANTQTLRHTPNTWQARRKTT